LGLKIHTAYSGKSVDSLEMIEILEALQGRGKYVLVHSEHNAVTAHPHYLANVANKYPDIKFILAHHGCMKWREACETAQKAENIFMDIVSSWNEYDIIKELVNKLGEDRLLYGSDIGLFDPAPFIGSILSSEISDMAKEKILYHNAKKLFCL